MKIAGTLGDLVKESTDAAAGFLRSKATAYGIKPPRFQKMDVHVHMPEGVTAKDRLQPALSDRRCHAANASPG